MLTSAALGMIYVLAHAVGVPVPGLGEPSGFGGYALRFLIAGTMGLVVGGISGVVLARHAQAEKHQRAAFLASFALAIRPGPQSAALPEI